MQRERVGLQRGEDGLPARRRPRGSRGCRPRARRTSSRARGTPTAAGRRSRCRPSASVISRVQVTSREMSCSACTGFCIVQVRQETILDHLEHDGRGPDLQEGGDLAHVGVAHDHVEPPVLLGIGVRLVARVDDGSLQRGLEPDLGLEEVGALRELVDRAGRARPTAPRHPPCPRPVNTMRVTKNGVRSRTMSPNGVARSIR